MAPRALRGVPSAAGWRRRRSGRISSRIRPRFVFGFEESTLNGRPSTLQYASVSSRQMLSSGRTMPSSRRTLIPPAVPLETRRKRIVSTWSDAVCPVARSRACEGCVPELAELGLREPSPRAPPTTAAPSSRRRTGILGRFLSAHAMVDVQRRHAIAERREHVPEAGGVRAPRDEAGHVTAGSMSSYLRICSRPARRAAGSTCDCRIAVLVAGARGGLGEAMSRPAESHLLRPLRSGGATAPGRTRYAPKPATSRSYGTIVRGNVFTLPNTVLGSSASSPSRSARRRTRSSSASSSRTR